MSEQAPVRVTAPGKINPFLAVGARRSDGFHPVANLYQAVDLFEHIEVVAAADPVLEFTGSIDTSGLSIGLDNLVWQAFRAVADEANIDLPSVRITVTKNVPIAGGMGGGSADAAAALVAASRFTGYDLGADVLLQLAANLGADVPFAVQGGTALGLGRGEQLTPVDSAAFNWVLVFNDTGLSTRAVFGELDRLRAAGLVEAPEAAHDADLAAGVIAALASGDPAALARELRNDLQEAALSLAPVLRETLAAGVEAGALAGMVSGSGPTLAFLADSREHARSIAARLVAGGRRAVAVTGDAPGARLVN